MSYDEITTPDWLLDAVPGAREAADNYAALIEVRASLATAERAAIADAVRVLTPAYKATTAEHEAASANKRAARQRVVEQDVKIKAALAAYRRLFAEFPASERVPLAASVAIERHARGAALWKELRPVLDARDSAWQAAGQPGRAWDTRNGIPAGGASYVAAQMSSMMDVRVGGFDLDAVRRVAEGDVVEPVKVPGASEIRPVGKSTVRLR